MTVSVGTGTVSGRVRDRVGWGEGLCRGEGGGRDGVAVLGGTVAVVGSTVSVWPGTVTVRPGTVTEGVPGQGYRGPFKTPSRKQATMWAYISWLLAMAPGLIVKNSLNDKDEVAIARNLHNY